MTAPWNLLTLESLGAVRARGREAIAFLQGQLSADMTQLADDRSLLAGYHNPQGRVLALLRLIAPAPGEVLAVLPRELVAPVLARLSTFVLRSKVVLTDDSPAWRFEGLVQSGASVAPASLPQSAGAVGRCGQAFIARVGEAPARWLIATPAAAPAAAAGLGLEEYPRGDPQLWRRLAVEAGEPQVYAATCGEFVAQMLNLDALGAIAFDKGCYTGQEVIARAHYRGRVKRRLQRFRTVEPRSLEPGDAAELADGRALRVVDAVRIAGGRCEFLAVAPLIASGGEAAGEAAPAGGGARLDAVQLPLPYALPD
ncbi:MAG: YgfZ/GcvT domain-containing protein [Steroidobacteraceae bacterium]